jgi:hypothetical protein
MQKNLFYGSLMDMLDTNDPLVILANNIDWSKFENEFKKHYKNENKGRPNINTFKEDKYYSEFD